MSILAQRAEKLREVLDTRWDPRERKQRFSVRRTRRGVKVVWSNGPRQAELDELFEHLRWRVALIRELTGAGLVAIALETGATTPTALTKELRRHSLEFFDPEADPVGRIGSAVDVLAERDPRWLAASTKGRHDLRMRYALDAVNALGPEPTPEMLELYSRILAETDTDGVDLASVAGVARRLATQPA